MRVTRLVAGLLIVLSGVVGYLFAALLAGTRDTTALSRICAQIDYVKDLQKELEGKQQSATEKPRAEVLASEEVRNEFRMLVEQCRAALSSGGE
jgi:hypothetical protein